jgi:hypothetical protein
VALDQSPSDGSTRDPYAEDVSPWCAGTTTRKYQIDGSTTMGHRMGRRSRGGEE